MELCTPLSFKNLPQEAIRLRLFPLSLCGEATKWLFELQKNSIKSWEELISAFHKRFFPPSKMIKLLDDIQNYMQRKTDPVHGLPSDLVLQFFYRSFDSINKGITDRLVQNGIMLQSFEVASFLLNNMTKWTRFGTLKNTKFPHCASKWHQRSSINKKRDKTIKIADSNGNIARTHEGERTSVLGWGGFIFRLFGIRGESRLEH